MFYLLLYDILENDRLSQRTLEDTFNDSVFKMLFDLDFSESVCRSSISDRLSQIKTEYFKQIYECIYEQFSRAYSLTDRLKYNLIRIDSSMVSETSTKLVEGLDNKSGKKAVKHSIAFDGILPCQTKTFTYAEYGSEDIRFIIRAKENRKYVELESMLDTETILDLGKLTLLKDSKVYLYTKHPLLYNVGETLTNSLKRRKGRKKNLPTMTGLQPPDNETNAFDKLTSY